MDAQNVPEYFDDGDDESCHTPDWYRTQNLHSSAMYEDEGESEYYEWGLTNMAIGFVIFCAVALALISGAVYVIVKYVHVYPKG